MFSDKFVSAGIQMNTFDRPVNAPYIRKEFSAAAGEAVINVTCTGFYRIFVNGKEWTKGIMAPYITNPDQILYYDTYRVPLVEGANCVAFILGNGLSNSLDYNVWAFERASFRSAPKLAFSVECGDMVIEAEGCKTHPSPIIFDDYHAGEWYDKNLEIEGFAEAGFDDSGWRDVISVPSPHGDKMATIVPPIVVEKELKAQRITRVEGGYVYDFGIVSAGNMRLTLRGGEKGQRIRYVHTEVTKDGIPCIDSLVCGRMKTNQTFEYVSAGQEVEVFEPYFSYVGCRYVYVQGIRDDQATEDLFVFMLMHGDFAETGYFECNDEVANRIEATIKNSDKSNLFYFPTDCPQREKNGWTGDAAISIEHMLANFVIGANLKAWLRLICKSQKKSGKLPGIVPTDTWGYLWGNGPTWDAVLFCLPYQTYRISGDVEILKENANAMLKYLQYAESKRGLNGLIAFGLGDWLQPYTTPSGHYCPLTITATLQIIDSARKAAAMFDVLNMPKNAEYARNLAEGLRRDFRKNCVDPKTMEVEGNCQTAQAFAMYMDVFTEFELPKAAEVLLRQIKRDNDALNVGFVGARVLFHVLNRIGETELAYRLITQNKYPSYGYMVANGATSSWECFEQVEIKPNGDMIAKKPYLSPSKSPDIKNFFRFLRLSITDKINPRALEGKVASLNHHAFGDVSNFFKRDIAGLRVNDGFTQPDHLDVKPYFIESLTYAEATRTMRAGAVKVRWERSDDKVILKISIPDGVFGKIAAPKGYIFAGGGEEKKLAAGEYVLVRA